MREQSWRIFSTSYLGLRRKQGRIGHDNDAAHDGMDTTLIGISAGRQAGDRVGAARIHGSGIESASATLLEASIVGDGMVSWGGIIPSDCRTGGDGGRGRHIVGRTTIHEDLSRRRSGRGRPSRHGAYRKTEYDDTPVHEMVHPVNDYASIIHRDRFDAEGFIEPAEMSDEREEGVFWGKI